MVLPTSILWLRHDLRLDDNPALHAALVHSKAVIPVFIWEPKAEGEWTPGGASRCWLHWSLKSLDAALREAGSRLIIRQGNTLDNLLRLLEETGANAVFWNRHYEPAITARDKEIEATLLTRGVTVDTFNSLLLFEPGTVQTKSSTPYRVFTPFYRACLSLPEPDAPLPAPKTIGRPGKWPASSKLEELGLLPRIPWDAGIRSTWTCGETASITRLHDFCVNRSPPISIQGTDPMWKEPLGSVLICTLGSLVHAVSGILCERPYELTSKKHIVNVWKVFCVNSCGESLRIICFSIFLIPPRPL